MPAAAPSYEPDTGDFVWITLNPVEGHEQSGRRPALVLSPIEYNSKTGLMLVCPITNSAKGYPFEQKVPLGMKPAGVVLCDQVRCVAWRERKAEKIGVAPTQLLEKVRGRIAALLQID